MMATLPLRLIRAKLSGRRDRGQWQDTSIGPA